MLTPLVNGEVRTCFGVWVSADLGHFGRELTVGRTEPNTGLETLKLRTQAVRDGDSYRISGQKM
jgi:acyl-CoA dehydrogenase